MTTATPATPIGRRVALRSVPALIVLILLAALGGCGSTTTPTTSTSASSASSALSASSASATEYPAGKGEICAARDQLQVSLAALISPAVLAGGGTAIEGAIEKVKTDLGAITAAGKQDYAPQVDALQSALQDVQSAVSNLGNGTAGAGSLAPAITATQTAATDLFSKLAADCD
jgi:hypothetical protein